MKKIGLIVSPKLPLPDVQGGAIEKLVEILLEENERGKCAEFYVYSIYNEDAAGLANQFKHTKFCHITFNAANEKIYWFCTHALRKIFHITTKYDSIYYKKIINSIKKENLDYVIAEGGIYANFRNLFPNISPSNLYLHIHHHYIPDKITAESFDNIIGVSEYVLHEYQKNVNRNLNLNLCRNCADSQNFKKQLSMAEKKTLRERLGFSENDFVVIYCGRIVEVKGVLELIQAILMTKEKEIKLLLIGSPDFGLKTTTKYYKKVIQLVQENKSRITHLGYVNNSEIFPYYQAADIQVIPSLWEEAAGIVAIEGMIAGRPLIVTNSGGMTEYVDEECALVIEKEYNVIFNIRDAIIRLYQDEALRKRMSEHALVKSRKFSREIFFRDFMNILNLE